MGLNTQTVAAHGHRSGEWDGCAHGMIGRSSPARATRGLGSPLPRMPRLPWTSDRLLERFSLQAQSLQDGGHCHCGGAPGDSRRADRLVLQGSSGLRGVHRQALDRSQCPRHDRKENATSLRCRTATSRLSRSRLPARSISTQNSIFGSAAWARCASSSRATLTSASSGT